MGWGGGRIKGGRGSDPFLVPSEILTGVLGEVVVDGVAVVAVRG